MDKTVFAPIYATWDKHTGQQVMFIFNDTPCLEAAQSFEQSIVRAIESVIKKPGCLLLTGHPLGLSVMICGIVTEGWTQFSCDMRAMVAELETLIEETPDVNIWDLQKLFGHLSFRRPSLEVLMELLTFLKEDNDMLGPM